MPWKHRTVHSGTILIKEGEIDTGRPCGSVALSGQSVRTVCERSWVRVPVGPRE